MYPGLSQLVDQLIEMGIPPLDESLPGSGYDAQGNRPAAVAVLLGPEAGLVAEGIDQPRLTICLFGDILDQFVFERLPGLFGMLGIEDSDIPMAEVPQAQGFGFDIEGSTAGNDLVIAVVDTVIPHIPHPAQEHGLREGARTIRVAGPDLAQQRDQDISHQAIHLVQ